uniref:Uncharacterized protein n=1 Tax=Siphoviridae sp. ctXQ014 TaxID=2825542 RepID=A0A8S5PMR8_9CAUD|nr:MAG TPA: hypothetical protein [Siphoviridae sp. ctXQ014]
MITSPVHRIGESKTYIRNGIVCINSDDENLTFPRKRKM